MTVRRHLDAAAVNNKIYIIGGYNGTGYLSTVEEYDPANNTVVRKTDMNVAREGLRVTNVNGQIYAIGGTNVSNGVPLNTVEVYPFSQGTGNPPPSGTKFTYTTTDFLGRPLVYHYDAVPKTSKFLLNALLADNPVYLAQRTSTSEKPLDTLERYYGQVGPAWIQILASMLKDVRVKYDNGQYNYADYMAISNYIRDMLKCSSDGYASLFQQYLAKQPGDIGWENVFRDINFRIVCSDESYANGNTADEIQMLIAAINGYVNLPILKAEQTFGLCMVAGSFISVVSSLADLIGSSNAATQSLEMNVLSKQMQKLESTAIQAEKDTIISDASIVIKAIAEGDERALSLSTRFLTQSDPLFKNAEFIEPIEGYQDIVCHGDKLGFVWKDLNGVESTVSVNEFAEILKNSPVYKGGPIRLISCETGADGAIAAQYLAKALGEEVMAPTDIVWVKTNGEMIIGPDQWTNTGTWKIFKP